MVSVPATVLEAAEIGVVHQADVTHLGAFDDHDIVLVEVLALMDEFHGCLQKGISCKSTRQDGQIMARSLPAPRVNNRPQSWVKVIYCRLANKKNQGVGEKRRLHCRRVFTGGMI
jgi:hypothetical protein